MVRKYTYLLLACCLLAACTRDDVEDIKFGVRVEKNENMNVTFSFTGDPDYIAFYSGDFENNYAHIDRSQVELAELELSCHVRQQYTDLSYLNEEVVFAYISEDFSGIYTTEELSKATWKPISGRESHRLSVPVPTSANVVDVSSSIDLAQFVGLDKSFYIAFQYNAAGRAAIPAANANGNYITRPRVDVTELTLRRQDVNGQDFYTKETSTEWGFRIIYQESVGTNYQLTDGGFIMQPSKGYVDDTTKKENDEVVWFVSKLLNPKEVEPDRGIAIKSIEGPLKSYTHTYRNPGDYTATFIATNANLWESQQQIETVKITVNP